MIEVEHTARTSPAAVWEVLCDGWLYASWVVGAVRMRDVDDSWPAVDARLHHSVGAWPLLLHDTTSVRTVEPGRALTLQARGWPFGEAVVGLRLRPADANPAHCTISMSEDASSGPGRLVPRPVRQAAVVVRNRESLRRLAMLAENGAGTR